MSDHFSDWSFLLLNQIDEEMNQQLAQISNPEFFDSNDVIRLSETMDELLSNDDGFRPQDTSTSIDTEVRIFL